MEHCFGTDSTISTSLIAVMPEHEIHKIYPPGVGSAPSSGFVPAVVCDDFVFVAGQMAHNAGQGLDPRAHKMADLSDNELHTGPITFMGTPYTHDLSGAKASVCVCHSTRSRRQLNFPQDAGAGARGRARVAGRPG
jgi:hypothetical protein